MKLEGSGLETTLTLLSSTLVLSMIFSAPVQAHHCETPIGFEFVEMQESNNSIGPKIDERRWSSKYGVTLVNFWAVWCPPCIKELPMLDRLAEQNTFNVQTVHLGGVSELAIKQRFSELNIQNLPKLMDPDFEQLYQFGFQGLPATMIVVNQKIRYRYSGYLRRSQEEINQWLTCLAKDKME